MNGNQTHIDMMRNLLSKNRELNDSEWAQLNAKKILSLLNDISSDDLTEALSHKNNDGLYGLHYAIGYQHYEVYTTLLNKITPTALNTLLALESDDGWNVLHIAAYSTHTNAFKTLLEKIDNDSLTSLLAQQTNDQWNVLHMAARYLKDDQLIALINRIDPVAFTHLVSAQNVMKSNVLHIAARHQNKEAFIALVEKLDPTLLYELIAQQNNEQVNVLHLAAYNKKCDVLMALLESNAFIELINKVQPFELEALIQQKTSNQLNVLHIAARYQPSHVFISLINKINQNALDNLIYQQDIHGWNTLHMAARYSDSNVLIALMDKIDQDPLLMLDLASQNQNINVFAVLLSIMNQKHVQNAFKVKTTISSHLLSSLLPMHAELLKGILMDRKSFIEAVMKYKDTMGFLIKNNKLSPNEPLDDEGATPLMLAIKNNHVSLAKDMINSAQFKYSSIYHDKTVQLVQSSRNLSTDDRKKFLGILSTHESNKAPTAFIRFSAANHQVDNTATETQKAIRPQFLPFTGL